MREFQQRRILRRWIYSRFSILFLFAVFIFFVFSIIGIYGKSMEATQKNDEVKNELNELKAKKDYLEGEINRLNTDAGVEKELRDKFQIAKPGEKVIVIVDDSGTKDQEIELEKNSNWFWRILGL